MGYWKSKVIPTIKKVFEKGGAKKAAAAEATKAFDGSKEEINKTFEEKKVELGPKVVEIFGAASPEIKTLVKERKESGLKKSAAGVNKFLEELVKIDFPGAKAASEISSKYGPALASGPVFFLFEKVGLLLPVDEPKAAEEPAAPPAAPAEEGTSKDKEIDVAPAEEKKPEAETPPPPEEKKAEEPAPVVKAEEPPPAAAAPAAEPEKKTEAAEPPKP